MEHLAIDLGALVAIEAGHFI